MDAAVTLLIIIGSPGQASFPSIAHATFAVEKTVTSTVVVTGVPHPKVAVRRYL